MVYPHSLFVESRCFPRSLQQYKHIADTSNQAQVNEAGMLEAGVPPWPDTRGSPSARAMVQFSVSTPYLRRRTLLFKNYKAVIHYKRS